MLKASILKWDRTVLVAFLIWALVLSFSVFTGVVLRLCLSQSVQCTDRWELAVPKYSLFHRLSLSLSWAIIWIVQFPFSKQRTCQRFWSVQSRTFCLKMLRWGWERSSGQRLSVRREAAVQYALQSWKAVVSTLLSKNWLFCACGERLRWGWERKRRPLCHGQLAASTGLSPDLALSSQFPGAQQLILFF